MSVYESRDPTALEVVRPGGEFEIIPDPEGSGLVFKGHPRTLTALYSRARPYGARPLIVDEGKRLSFDEVFTDAARFAWTLREKFRVRPGDRVAIDAANRTEWIVAFVAITSLRAIAVCVNPRGAAEEMLRAIRLTRCTAGVVDAERAAQLAAENPLAGRWISIDGDPGLLGGMSYRDALAAAPAKADLSDDAKPGDGAAAFFTSGTTGFPKAALLTHGALAHMVSLLRVGSAVNDAQYRKEIGDVKDEYGSPMVLASPLFHLSGVAPMLRAMHYGSPLLVVRKWNVNAAFDLVEKQGVNRLGFIVTMLWDMANSARATASNLAGMRFAAMGGMQIPETLVSMLAQKMPKTLFANAYGATETAGVGVRVCGRAFIEHPRSCGWPHPSMQLRIERDDGSDADVGEIGEVCMRGACLMKEYMFDPEATREAFRGGWYHMGDLGYVNEQGMLHIVDRKKNMVISGGENIYCAEVERVLDEHEVVAESVAFGVPDDRLGERLVAVVVPKPGAVLIPEVLKEYAAKRLAIYKVPRAIHLRTEPLPRTGTGKVMRRDLRALVPGS